ncbi:hypothetical protein AB0O65_08370 [Microbacterium sp. NPDC077391]|uniref:hypothetical protein n=1 Tax=Microbacterium sp. NPDC077391 TaxID=3154765 RepID=UPI0034232BE0
MILFYLALSAVIGVTGVVMVLGQQRFARNASHVPQLARYYSSPRAVTLWGTTLVLVSAALATISVVTLLV